MARNKYLALQLNSEIAAVITAMRQNTKYAKWAVVPGKYNEEDHMEQEPHYEDFRTLRRKIFEWDDWTSIHPLEYLSPFLKLVREPDVSGPITGVALTALWHMLSSDVIDASAKGAAEAINQIVEDTTQCKFEASDPASDEVVLFNILQVLQAVVKCNAGMHLTDESMCKAYQAAFMLGNLDSDVKSREKGCSELLIHFSRQIIGEMTTTIFSRVTSPPLSGEDQPPNGQVCSPSHGPRCAVEVLTFLMDLVYRQNQDSNAIFGLQMVHRALLAGGPALAEVDILLTLMHQELFSAMTSAVQSGALGAITGVCQLVVTLWVVMGQHMLLQLEAIIGKVLLRLADGKGINSKDSQDDEEQEAALEGILDLCRQPGFAHDVFVNCDCRIERSNLYEDICSLVSKTAFPVTQKSLGPLHHISLEALLAILSQLSSGPPSSSGAQSQIGEPQRFVDIWTPLSHGQQPVFGPQPMDSSGSSESSSVSMEPNTPGEVSNSFLENAMKEKLLKTKVTLAAEHFNKDYKKGFQYLQVNHLLPKLCPGPVPESPVPDTSPSEAESGDSPSIRDCVDEDTLAQCVGAFLRVCPNLSKTAIGELLGEPDQFYLKILDAFTRTFDFAGLSELPFDSALRLYLESFKLPGESQKIDRIVNVFGKYYHEECPSVLATADAAYILAYSIIMLNTDRHSSQVRNKMTIEQFRRNLRGCNGNTDFPEDFLNNIYMSILRSPLSLSDMTSLGVSRSVWLHLAQLGKTPRGKMVATNGGRGILDSHMFHLMWGPAVHAISVVLEYSENAAMTEMALQGLKMSVRIAANHDIEDVADGIVLALCKFTAPLNPASVRPRISFGRDLKACAAVQTLFSVVNRYGDYLRSGWQNVMDLVVRLHKLDLLPPGIVALFEEMEEGSSAGSAKDSPRRYKRVQSSQQLKVMPSSFFKSVSSQITQLIALPTEPEYVGGVASAVEKECEQRTVQCLEECHIEDMFADSKFLKPEALQKLVQAIIFASGPLPRLPGSSGVPGMPPPSPHQSLSGAIDWEVVEVCLDLLLVVLLRNRDRIGLLWGMVMEHFQTIIKGKGVDAHVVERAATGILRLCQRLLPYKPEVAEPLLKGLNLVQVLDPEMAWQNAEKIAAEMLVLIKRTASHIQHQWAWACVCNLLKMTSVRPEAFPLSFEAFSWTIKECLTPVNYPLCLEAAAWFAERAAGEHVSLKADALQRLEALEVWLEVWSDSLTPQVEVVPEDERPSHWTATIKANLWILLIDMLCKMAEHLDREVRSTATSCMLRAIIAAEKMGVPAASLEHVLTAKILPLVREVIKRRRGKDLPQGDYTIRDLVKIVSKMLLLFLPVLQPLPSFTHIWLQILDILPQAANSRSEVLSEALPEAFKNMLLVLHAKGLLIEGWRSVDGMDLWQLTWFCGRKLSSNLTPSMLQAPIPYRPHPPSPAFHVPLPHQEGPTTMSPQPGPLGSSDTASTQSVATEGAPGPSRGYAADASAKTEATASSRGEDAPVVPQVVNGSLLSALQGLAREAGHASGLLNPSGAESNGMMCGIVDASSPDLQGLGEVTNIDGYQEVSKTVAVEGGGEH